MASIVSNLISNIVPSDKQTEVKKNAPVSIVFKESMDSSSINEETIIFKKGNKAVPSTYSFNKAKKELTITPNSELLGGQTYNVSVLTRELGPKTAFGNLSGTDYSIYFTTEEDAVIVPPEEPVVEDTEVVLPGTPILPDGVNLSLIDSYPVNGQMVKELPSIILKFDAHVDAVTAQEFVYIRKKAISTLLGQLTKSEKIPLIADINSGEDTVILNPSIPLFKGTSYEIVIGNEVSAKVNPALKLGTDKLINFLVEWEMYYTNVEAVKLLLGMFKDSYTDEEIAEMIHQESLATYQMMSMKADFDPLLWQEVFPYAASKYVLYRVAFQCMLGQVIETSSGMKDSIKLGDLAVSESSSVSSEITNLLGLFKDEMDKWWKLLNGIEEDENGVIIPKLSKITGSATRGVTDQPYPAWLTRVPFRDLGG